MWSTIISSAKFIPWGKILINAPMVAETVEKIIASVNHSRNIKVESLDNLTERVLVIENNSTENAKLIRNISGQLVALTNASKVLANRILVAIIISGLALTLSIIALII